MCERKKKNTNQNRTQNIVVLVFGATHTRLIDVKLKVSVLAHIS